MAGVATILLDEQLHLAKKLASRISDGDSDAARLAAVCLRLDHHMRRGGALPEAWIDIHRHLPIKTTS